MTDKQIIIDEIDVSGCEFAPKEIGWCNNGNLSSYCKENPNCYYKQLKRKEQECEELKKQRTAYIKEAEENFEVHTTLKDNYRKLYQTLTEIKEIAETHYCFASGNCKWCANIGNCTTKQILQKISEVEDANI